MAEKDQHHGHGGSYTRNAPDAARTLVERTDADKADVKQPAAKKPKAADGAGAANQQTGSALK